MHPPMEPPKRKHPAHLPNVERHNQPTIIFLTICTSQRKPALANLRMHALLKETWPKAAQWIVGRYIIMPDHIHLFCSPSRLDSENVKDWAGYWKGLITRQTPELKPLWQRDCWDTQLRQIRHYDEKWHYVVHNPVRKGLVTRPDDWPYQGVLNELRW